MKNETKLEIYPGREQKSFVNEIRKLNEANLSQTNKKLIQDFQEHLFSTGSGNIRVAKVSGQLRAICRWIENHESIQHKNLDKLDVKDVTFLISFINKLEQYSENTRTDYRRAVKQFFKWFKDEDNRVYNKHKKQRDEAKKLYTYLDNKVSSHCKQKQANPNTILTDEDIEFIVDRLRTPREQAFLRLLHETGCRAGEFLNLRIGDLDFRNNGTVKIRVPDGKTGRRTIFVAKSTGYLRRYLEIHSFRTNNNSFLWLSEAGHNRNEPLLYIGAQRLVNRCFERALEGLNQAEQSKYGKRHNLHWFRHSRATILAPLMTEAMLCKYMGWSIGSRQVKTYLHLCTKQLEDVYLSIHGIKDEEKEKSKPIKCNCGALNSPKDRYCYQCYKPLSVDVAIQDNDENIQLMTSEAMKTMQFFMEMSKNPEMMKKFEEFKKEMG